MNRPPYLTNDPAIEYLNLRAAGERPVEALTEMARWRADAIETLLRLADTLGLPSHVQALVCDLHVETLTLSRALAHVAIKAPPQ